MKKIKQIAVLIGYALIIIHCMAAFTFALFLGSSEGGPGVFLEAYLRGASNNIVLFIVSAIWALAVLTLKSFLPDEVWRRHVGDTL